MVSDSRRIPSLWNRMRRRILDHPTTTFTILLAATSGVMIILLPRRTPTNTSLFQLAWDAMIREMANNPTTTILASLSVLFGFTSVMLWFKGNRSQKPCCRVQSFNIVKDFSNKFPSFQFLKNGHPVDNLTVTRFAYWNSGRDSIKMETDVPPSDPIRLGLTTGHQVLEEPNLLATYPANGVQLRRSKDGTEVIVEFVYFGTNEGFAAEILHDGTSSEDVQFLGTVMNRKLRHFPGNRMDQQQAIVFMTAFVVLGLVQKLLMIVDPSIERFAEQNSLLSFIPLVVATVCAWFSVSKQFGLPKYLNVFNIDAWRDDEETHRRAHLRLWR